MSDSDSDFDFDPRLLESIPDPLGPRAGSSASMRFEQIGAELPVGIQPALQALPTGSARRTRTELQRARWIAVCGSLLWLGMQLGLSGIRGDMSRVPWGYTLALVGLPCVAGIGCIAVALAPGRLGLGLRTGLLMMLALLCPAGFLLVGGLQPLPYPEVPLGNFQFGLLCFNVAMGWTLLPLVLAAYALKNSFVGRAGYRSALVGGGIGLIVASASALRCPLSAVSHVVFSHGGAVIASALLGAYALSRVTRV
ncbi:MAG TPA: hypothetical protein VFQ61_11250 [Polyangiaceae bacterium]|nr:hypothetical protein [Polyangiaceae bacterium]